MKNWKYKRLNGSLACLSFFLKWDQPRPRLNECLISLIYLILVKRFAYKSNRNLQALMDRENHVYITDMFSESALPSGHFCWDRGWTSWMHGVLWMISSTHKKEQFNQPILTNLINIYFIAVIFYLWSQNSL